jgi:hypothetical protein
LSVLVRARSASGISQAACFLDAMIRFTLLLILGAIAGCTHVPAKVHDPIAKQEKLDAKLALFSTNAPNGLPVGWEPLILLRTKKETQYGLMKDDGRTVLHAKAQGASSGLMHTVSIDATKQPWLNWRWKIANLITSADNSRSATEDSPVRIVLAFDGDKDGLSFSDQILYETARVMTGRELPYATLMYIWENKAPVETVIPNTRSKRFQKLVVASGTHGIGEWHTFTRNIVEDYEKAFGEKPGKLIGVGVMTDTDNTGETAEAWYGDIRLLREKPLP